ncbi:MAG: hypothetical protein ACI8VC_001216 [Candidatus Endobugula sp.]|jgi:hypothetical protein
MLVQPEPLLAGYTTVAYFTQGKALYSVVRWLSYLCRMTSHDGIDQTKSV